MRKLWNNNNIIRSKLLGSPIGAPVAIWGATMGCDVIIGTRAGEPIAPGTPCCVMLGGSAWGTSKPCSFFAIKCIAMENSRLSIFPSLFKSASSLRKWKNELTVIGKTDTLILWKTMVRYEPNFAENWRGKSGLHEELLCLFSWNIRNT